MRAFKLLTPIISTLIVSLIGTGCFSSRVYLPVEEIDRPLSLPPASGTAGVEWRISARSDDHTIQSRNSQPIIVPPYFKLGNKSECYLPGLFRYHLLKNIDIQGATVRTTGANAALTAGMNSVGYSGFRGVELNFCAGINYKRPLDEKVWLESEGYLRYTTAGKVYGGYAQGGFGYQISRNLYATFIPMCSIYNPNVNDGNYFSFPEAYQSFTLPLLFGININRAIKLFWRSSLHYYRDNSVMYGQGLGISYTW